MLIVHRIRNERLGLGFKNCKRGKFILKISNANEINTDTRPLVSELLSTEIDYRIFAVSRDLSLLAV